MRKNSNNNDNTISISYFKEKVREFVKERKWEKYQTPQNLIQALGIEISELSQLFLFKDYSIEDIKNNNHLLKNLSEEIADVFIYLICLVNTLNFDLTEIFIKKMEKNKEKYSITEFNNGIYYKK